MAHIGGALFGCMFAWYRKGHIRLRLFEPVFAPKSVQKPFKVEAIIKEHSAKSTRKPADHQYAPTQEEIDAILDKISKTGYDRLSKEEKDILFKASQE